MQLTAKQIQGKLNGFHLDAIESLRAAGALRPEQIAVLSAPFLLNVVAAKAYFDAPVRIMFVGQETLTSLPAALGFMDRSSAA